jgi:hypothetical protein
VVINNHVKTGFLKIGDNPGACNSSNSGHVRFKDGHFDGCNGTTWVRLDKTTTLTPEEISEQLEFLGDEYTLCHQRKGEQAEELTGTLVELWEHIHNFGKPSHEKDDWGKCK